MKKPIKKGKKETERSIYMNYYIMLYINILRESNTSLFHGEVFGKFSEVFDIFEVKYLNTSPGRGEVFGPHKIWPPNPASQLPDLPESGTTDAGKLPFSDPPAYPSRLI